MVRFYAGQIGAIQIQVGQHSEIWYEIALNSAIDSVTFFNSPDLGPIYLRTYGLKVR